MSITRQLFNEFRPLIRMFEEPLARGAPSTLSRSPFFDDAFLGLPRFNRMAVDVTEKGNNYVVEADLPGVPKENVEVRIGDDGRSVSIEGSIVSQANAQPAGEEATSDTQQVAQTETSNQISSERQVVGNASFSRTVWLPQPVDSTNVSAQLKDGVLTISIPKAEGKGSVKIPVV